jgi:fibronectin-binding autotransporter adhesin
MATYLWTGTTDGDWKTGDNWSGGVVPGAADTVIFNTGDQTITGTSITGVAEIKILEGFTGTFGSTGTPLSASATDLYISTEFGTVNLDGTYTTAHITQTKATESAVLFGSSSSITTLRVTGGLGRISVSSSTITNVEVSGSPGIEIQILAAAGNFNSLTMDSGIVRSQESLTGTANISGGEYRLESAAGAATVNIYGKGVVSHQSSGTITTASVFDKPSVLDFTQNTSTGPTVTTTNLYDGTINERNGSANVTYTNGITVKGKGSILADVARTLTVT